MKPIDTRELREQIIRELAMRTIAGRPGAFRYVREGKQNIPRHQGRALRHAPDRSHGWPFDEGLEGVRHTPGYEEHDVGGILGANVLTAYDAVIDLGNDTLVLTWEDVSG